jgi:glycosyltransferase involved in cell wall biosynthesis
MNGSHGTHIDPGRQWDGLAVLCAANNYDGIKLADQHMAEELARLRPVLYVDPPISVLTPKKHPYIATSLQQPRLRMQSPGLARLTPVVQPLPARRGMTVVTNILLRTLLRRATARLGGTVDAVVSAWPLHPIFGACRERTSIYWAQDDFVGGAALLGLNAAHLGAGELRVAAQADAIVAANPLVDERWRRSGSATHLIPFGVDAAAYEAVDHLDVPKAVSLPRPIAGFVGHINDRTDLALLEAIAARGRSLLLVGPRHPAFEPERWNALIARTNVAWVGPQPFSALPPYLAAIDVGLVPYRDSAFNRGSFPLKTLEYLAAGRPVVATDLPATRWLNTDLVTVATAPSDFADAVDVLLDRPRTGPDVCARRAFAIRHSWARRAADLLEVIDGSPVAQRSSRSAASLENYQSA